MRSKYEKLIAQDLFSRGVTYGYEKYSYEYDAPISQRRVSCLSCGSTDLVRTAWYTPDFWLPSGTIVEAKGRFTAFDRRKILAVREDHEELLENLKMIFMRDNKIHKNSTTKYSDWCEANGIDYAIGTAVPEEWL